MEKNNQSVDIKSLSKEQRAALMAQLQQEEKEDRIALKLTRHYAVSLCTK